MKILNAIILCAMLASAEELPNGIFLPAAWPPHIALTGQPMIVPYLEDPPEVIRIDTGRQLFIDDFLIRETTLHRTWHQPEYYSGNPVLKPETKIENSGPAPFAGPFSGGVWYDGRDRIFKIWYTCGYLLDTCYATSKDGIHWTAPTSMWFAEPISCSSPERI